MDRIAFALILIIGIALFFITGDNNLPAIFIGGFMVAIGIGGVIQ